MPRAATRWDRKGVRGQAFPGHQIRVIKSESPNPSHQIRVIKSESSNPSHQIRVIKSESSNPGVVPEAPRVLGAWRRGVRSDSESGFAVLGAHAPLPHSAPSTPLARQSSARAGKCLGRPCHARSTRDGGIRAPLPPSAPPPTGTCDPFPPSVLASLPPIRISPSPCLPYPCLALLGVSGAMPKG